MSILCVTHKHDLNNNPKNKKWAYTAYTAHSYKHLDNMPAKINELATF